MPPSGYFGLGFRKNQVPGFLRGIGYAVSSWHFLNCFSDPEVGFLFKQTESTFETVLVLCIAKAD